MDHGFFRAAWIGPRAFALAALRADGPADRVQCIDDRRRPWAVAGPRSRPVPCMYAVRYSPPSPCTAAFHLYACGAAVVVSTRAAYTYI